MGERAGLALTGVTTPAPGLLMARVSRSREEEGVFLLLGGAAGASFADLESDLLLSSKIFFRAWIFSFLLRDLLADSKSSSMVLGCMDLTFLILGNRPGESYFSLETLG